MPKLSVALKQDECLARVCRCAPAAWPKLRRTSRLFVWRLEEERLNGLQQQLIEERGLVFMDLHELAERGDAESLWMLLSQGISAKVRNSEGATLLQKATSSGRTCVLLLLAERGAIVNAKGAYGYTPLHEACYVGHVAVVECLLKLKANVDALSKNGSTPLLVAAREGHTAIVQQLLMSTADADDGGDKESTPLIVAACEGEVEVCETLLRFNANVQGLVTDGRHPSPLQAAAEHGHLEVVRLLLGLGADVNYTVDTAGTGSHFTAYDLAVWKSHSDVAALIADKSKVA